MRGSLRSSLGGWARATFAAVLLHLAFGATVLAVSSSAVAQEGATVAVEPPRLNPTGRVLMMPMPLMDGDRNVGEVVARIEPDDSIWVRRDVLVRLLGESVKPQVLAAIERLPDVGGHVSIAALSQCGAELRFEQAEVALRIVPKADLRTTQKISLGGARPGLANARTVAPASLSGYLNIIGGVDHLWASDNSTERTGLHFDLQSAVRFGDVVLENETGYDGEVDAETCPHDAFCTYEHASGFKRRNTRLVRDLPEQAMRFQAGDASTRPAGFQRVTDILGVAVERSPRVLQPDTANHATASQSFVVERPSQAEIAVNGAIVRRLKLQPGNYDLRDLTLVTGSNDVEVTLIDDTGARRTLSRSTYYDRRLLTENDSEWSLSGGLPSYYKDGAREYVEDDYAVSGYYRWGFTDRVTSEVNAQADSNVAMAGAGLLVGTSVGFVAARSSISQSSAGTGFAVGVDWDLINFGDFNGLIAGDGPAQQSLRLSAEYRSDDFRIPGERLTTASGLIYPSHDYWLRLSGSYTLPIGWGVSATLAGRYQFGRDTESDTLYSVRGDRYGADVTFNGALSETISGSLGFGYSNESYLVSAADGGNEAEADFRVLARAFVRLGSNTHVTTSHDSLNRQTIVTGYHSSGQGVDRWEATVDAYGDDRASGGSLGGTLGYYGNRGEVRLAHNTALTDLTWSGLDSGVGQQRTSLRVGTSIAFADGKFGIGAPVRGGFAIVYPHESLQDKTINIGTRDYIQARVDGWGAAVVPNLPAYSTTSLPLDVVDLPVGYSLGSGAFDVRAPYRGGYSLMVGSGFSVSVYGTLVDGKGEPVALLSGVAYRDGDRAHEVTVITNASGRFAAEGLAPGRWRIEMSGEAQTLVYSVDVPEGSDGLVRAGTLHPDGSVPVAHPHQQAAHVAESAETIAVPEQEVQHSMTEAAPDRGPPALRGAL